MALPKVLNAIEKEIRSELSSLVQSEAKSESPSPTPGGLMSSSKQKNGKAAGPLKFYGRFGGGLEVDDLFFNWADLDGNDYRKVLGYEFILYNGDELVMRMALPLNPQNIKMSMKHASNLQVTQRGIIEEHNGAPLRPISIVGTMGVFNTQVPTQSSPNTSVPAGQSVQESFFEKAFKGAFSSTQRAVDQLVAVANGTPVAKLNYSQDDVNAISKQFNSVVGETGSNAKFTPSGYSYMHMLERFFSYYMAVKKRKSGSKLRLVFAMHKDKMYYDCSFRDMNISKPPGSLEYQYSIQLIAWKRRADLNGLTLSKTKPNQQRKTDSNLLQDLMDNIRKSRNVIAAASRVLSSVRSDIETFTDPIKEAGLLIAESIGLVADIAMLPSAIIKNAESNINAAINAVSNASNEFGDAMKEAQSNHLGSGTTFEIQKQLDQASNPNKPSSILGGMNPTDQDSPINQLQRSNSGGLPAGGELLTLGDVQLPIAVQKQVNDEIDRVKALNADHFRKAKLKMASYAADISEQLGGGSSTYNRVVNRGDVTEKSSTLTPADIILLSEMQQAMQSIDGLINFLDQSEESQTNGYVDFYANLARQNSLTFEDSASKKFVPMPAGFTLEQLAYQYLDDDERWIEIAAINGLRTPYVDEVGITRPLLSSGAGNSLPVANSENLYIGQKIELNSNAQNPEIRKITELDVRSEISTIITVDGENDLSKFIITDNPTVKSYLPNTVNSNNMIAIPSDSAVTVANKISTSPRTEDIDKLIQIAQTDFLLTSSGDLAVTSAGDILLSFGLQNIQQAAVLKTRTTRGDLLSYPSYGNLFKAGANIADLNVGDTLNVLNTMFLNDPRFNSIPIARIRIDGVAAVIDMMLSIAGVETFLPLTAEIPR